MKYITTAVLALGAGVALGLTEAQAAPRKHVLAPIPGRKNWYTTSGPVQFKVGEIILCDDELPKGLADAADTAEKKAAKARAQDQAKEAAAAADADAQARRDELAADIAALTQQKADLVAVVEALAKAKADAEALAKTVAKAADAPPPAKP